MPLHLPALCSLLSEAYLPWLNELSAEHLARQVSTFACYLDLLGQGMEWQAVLRQLMAFMRVGGAGRAGGVSELTCKAVALVPAVSEQCPCQLQ